MIDADIGTLRIRIDLPNGAAFAAGRLDRQCATALVEAVILITRAGHRVVCVDLQALTAIDPCGVKVVAGLGQTLAAHGLHLDLRGAEGAVATALTAGHEHQPEVVAIHSREPERVP